MATYLDIETFPKNVIQDLQFQFRVTARLASGAIDAAYTGTVNFTSTDPEIEIVPLAPLPGVTLTAGTRLFYARMQTIGAQSVVAQDLITPLIKATARTTVTLRPVGWGLDDQGILPYGDANGPITVFMRKASAITTREVDATVSNRVTDNTPYVAGDALNPSTWLVQRLDTLAYLHVINVTQVGGFTYRLLTLEEFGPVGVVHRVSSSTLLALDGGTISNPMYAEFFGLLDKGSNPLDRLKASSNATRDIANPQFPAPNWFAGTLQLDAFGDYKLESGKELVRKLILRRLFSTPGDFFHMPNYGIGIKLKEPIPSSTLGSLKTQIEQQCLQEREVETVKASVTLASNGVLSINVRARLRPSGETVEIGFKSNDGVLML